MLGNPMPSPGGPGGPGAAAGLAAPPRDATIPATAPPATAAATAIHFLRLVGAAFALAAPPRDSATYWNDTVPARACSLDARIRIRNLPGRRLASKPCRLARPWASAMTTSVRSPLTNAPLGPSSGRWKLTAAPATGLPVSSVISTVIGRVLRDPGRCTAPSPSITRICRMATWASAGAAHSTHKAARPTQGDRPECPKARFLPRVDTPACPRVSDFSCTISLGRMSAARGAKLSDFSHQHDGHVVRPPRLLGRLDQILAAFLERSATAAAVQDLFHLRGFQHAVQSVAANQYQIARRQGHAVVVDGQRGAGADGHGEHMPHGVMTQAFLVEPQGAADFVDPRLIVGDDVQAAGIDQIGAAVAHTGDGEFLVQVEGGHQGSAHAFQTGVVTSRFEHPPVGLLDGADQHLGIALGGQTDDFGHRLHRDARGMLARLGATHAVGEDIKPALGVDETVIFIVGSDTSHIRQREGFQHVHESAPYATVARARLTVKWEGCPPPCFGNACASPST